ncbi:MAG: NAD+ synthase [Actinomycetota bacterium]|nr:NAD+ synthase [Actinomycetota bacterium]
MRVALAQINTVVGDLDGNRERISERLEEARRAGADVVLFPELAVTGYPPEDLLLRPGFLRAAARALEAVAEETKGITALVGVPLLDRDLFNACAVCVDGEVKAFYRKHFLPNYGVFDEDRYFQPGTGLLLLRCGDTLLGPTVCEDVWQPGPPATDLALAGAHVVANISASPFHVGKGAEREQMLATRARDNACWIAFVNAVGGQDELVFDGHSLVLDEDGQVVARGPAFEEALIVVDVDATTAVARRLRDARRRALARARTVLPDPPVVDVPQAPPRDGVRASPVFAPSLGELEQIRLALELGLRDYVEKNGFADVVLGVSGGIDSAVAAAVAVGSLGHEHVVCVSMPSRYSSAETRRDAKLLARNLDTRYLELPIHDIVDAIERVLARPFAGTEPGIAEENVQARARGLLLMALSNKFGWLPLATGNKSELSVGYATLYGDMAGGFALLKDVYKTDVFRLARHLNELAGRDLIPRSIIERAPSAELRTGQLDEDSLPAYPKLDRVLEAYVELDSSLEELTSNGFEPDVAERAVAMIDRAEYKRRQAPPGVKLRPRAFGRDRRIPITNRWRG